MSEAYLGEIRIFAGTYAPVHWNLCNGQLVNISDYSALFAVLGTTYGGDGRVNFALPDFRGRIPVHMGQALGQDINWSQGLAYGQEYVTLTENQIPAHNHSFNVSVQAATETNPTGNVVAAEKHYVDSSATTSVGSLDDLSLEPFGGGQEHYNMMPYVCFNFIICMNGLFPQRP